VIAESAQKVEIRGEAPGTGRELVERWTEDVLQKFDARGAIGPDRREMAPLGEFRRLGRTSLFGRGAGMVRLRRILAPRRGVHGN
jgi:hypothetical protein